MPRNSEHGDSLKEKLGQTQVDSVEVGGPFVKTKLNPHGKDPSAAPNKQAEALTRIAEAEEAKARAHAIQAAAVERIAGDVSRVAGKVGKLLDVVVDRFSADQSSNRTIDAPPARPGLPAPKKPSQRE